QEHGNLQARYDRFQSRHLHDCHSSACSFCSILLSQRGLGTLSSMSMAEPSSSFQSERDKMRHGEEYNYMNLHLRHDREVCKVSLSRFNNSATSGTSSDERERQLRLISRV